MGQMLRETERAKPPNPKPPKERRSPDDTDDAPTLAELGLTKRESADAQLLAELPAEEFEKIKAGKKTRAKAKKERKEEQKQRAMEKAAREISADKSKSLLEVCDVRHCSCAELFASGIKPDAVITDPPFENMATVGRNDLCRWPRSVPGRGGRWKAPAFLSRGESVGPKASNRRREYLLPGLLALSGGLHLRRAD